MNHLDWLQTILIIVLVVASINFILFAAKNERVRTVQADEDFTLYYPRVYLWLCIVFFLLVSVLVLNMIVRQSFSAPGIVITAILLAVGIPFLLLSLVWKITVKPEYIIFRNQFGVKKQIYYKDISRAVLGSGAFTMFTTLKTYRFSPRIAHLEYFLKRLHMNGIEVERQLR